MTEFEKKMIDILGEMLANQESMAAIQDERNEILKAAFVVYDGAIPALEKLVMFLDK